MNYPDVTLVDTNRLSPHPLSLKVYGEIEDLSDLVESIRAAGVLHPLLVTADYCVISGKRRLAAARQIGLAQVPVLISSLAEPLEIELAVLEANRAREKTNEQKGREYLERLRIEKSLAEQRADAGRKAGGLAAGRGRAKEPEELCTFSAVADPLPKLVEDEEIPSNRLVENFPPTYSGKSRDLAATPLGWSGRTAEKAAAVIQYADQTGDQSVLDLLNQKSAHSAFARVRDIQGGVTPPPFTPQYANVWNFPGPTPGLGTDYPGRIPGDILRNLFWLYTQPDDLVVDPFAGGGVTLDAVTWWNQQPGLWPLRCLAYDLVPSREGIIRHDTSQPPHLPEECQAAGLVFLDPPYWRQKRGAYSADATNLTNLPLEQFHQTLACILNAGLRCLRPGGYLALIIGATQYQGEFVDHTLLLASQVEGRLVQRISVPYTTQQFSPADVAQARKSKFLLKGYRDLCVWQPKERFGRDHSDDR